MFDTDEETFLERIPYPEALSRAQLHVGETWKLAANVQYIRDAVASAEREHEMAIQDVEDEATERAIESNDETRADCIHEIRVEVLRTLNLDLKDAAMLADIRDYLEDLK